MADQKPKVIQEFDSLINQAVSSGDASLQLVLEGMKLLATELHDLNVGISQLIKYAEPDEGEDKT